MSLADEIAKRKAQERVVAARRSNPELEAQLDRFIAEHPRALERYSAMNKEELVRTLMRAKMERAEIALARNRELESWVKEHPEIVVQVECRANSRRLKTLDAVGLHAAKAESVRQDQRAPRLRL